MRINKEKIKAMIGDVTQAEVVRQLGWSRQRLNEKMRGRAKFSLEDLNLLARIFNCKPIEFLIFDEGEQND